MYTRRGKIVLVSVILYILTKRNDKRFCVVMNAILTSLLQSVQSLQMICVLKESPLQEQRDSCKYCRHWFTNFFFNFVWMSWHQRSLHLCNFLSSVVKLSWRWLFWCYMLWHHAAWCRHTTFWGEQAVCHGSKRQVSQNSMSLLLLAQTWLTPPPWTHCNTNHFYVPSPDKKRMKNYSNRKQWSNCHIIHDTDLET